MRTVITTDSTTYIFSFILSFVYHFSYDNIHFYIYFTFTSCSYEHSYLCSYQCMWHFYYLFFTFMYHCKNPILFTTSLNVLSLLRINENQIKMIIFYFLHVHRILFFHLIFIQYFLFFNIKDNNESPPDGISGPSSAMNSCEEMTMDEIFNGKGKYYPGLIPLVYAYLDYIKYVFLFYFCFYFHVFGLH